MTSTYRSFIDVTGLNDVTDARSFVLNGVQSLAANDGIFLSQNRVVDLSSLGIYEKEGRDYLQATLVIGR